METVTPFYSAIVVVEILSAIAIISVICTNPIIPKRSKIAFGTEFIACALTAFFEWFNIYLNGSPENLRVLHYAVKIIQFSLVIFMIGTSIMLLKSFKYRKILLALVIIHFFVECAVAPFGLIIRMDENNVYSRGSLHYCYVGFYVIGVITLLVCLFKEGEKYQSNSRAVVIIGTVFCAIGVMIQLISGNIKTSCLTMEFALTLTYLYVNSLLLQTDKLTSLLNRWCYEKKVEEIDYQTCIIYFDVDNFKSINDTFGHQVGDEALKTTSSLILETFGKEARCYRIGGDEFCAIIKKRSKYAKSSSAERMSALIDRFKMNVADARKKDPRFTNISVGYAFTEVGFSANWAVEQADQMMYENKMNNKAVRRA